MSKHVYVGIENEFIVYERLRNGDYCPVGFPRRFPALLKGYDAPCYRKSNLCIRTMHGSSIYADGDEAETCTPPVRVRPGFAIDIKDVLHNARHDLTTFLGNETGLSIVGYSMHHNISAEDTMLSNEAFMRYYDVPLAMFGLTPRSIGTNLRIKPNRREFLADHVPDEEQIVAFHILYAAAQLYPQCTPEFKLRAFPNTFSCGYRNILPQGRDTKLVFTDNAGREREMTAQEYLERTHDALGEAIDELTIPVERKILEEYITGKRQLEIDKEEKYLVMKKRCSGVLMPDNTTILDRSRYTNPAIIPKGVPRALAAFGRSDIPRDHPMNGTRTLSLGWESVAFFRSGQIHTINGLTTMELLGEMINTWEIDSRRMNCANAIDTGYALVISEMGPSERYPALLERLRNPNIMDNDQRYLSRNEFIEKRSDERISSYTGVSGNGRSARMLRKKLKKERGLQNTTPPRPEWQRTARGENLLHALTRLDFTPTATFPTRKVTALQDGGDT